ncbi:hypothetical protein HK103_002846 [Boothiomyces macroporosus]|uniref:RRM domain-containing protein n=1 Tax=Boothiomyces macroporosus TaxID=261099 RepID=A0AAD5ULP3_9FUNG|nr:hypothetical protein HK103_002826 [Boothiomyces macroporosus]KAJ3259199.1 hypothetical protein HK103_002846 [Boothiomyces macroporosus]
MEEDISPQRGSPERREFRDRSLSPRRQSPERRDAGAEEASTQTNLFITGLTNRIRENDLIELFSKYGKVEKCHIMRDPHTGDSRGFGFINYTTVAEADAALALDGYEFMEKTLIVQKAKRARARTPTPGQYRGPIKERRPDFDRRGYGRYDPYDRRDYDRRPPYDRYDQRGYDRGPRRDYDRRDYDRYDRGYDRPPPRRYEDREMDRGYDRRPPPSGDNFDRRPPPYERERRF